MKENIKFYIWYDLNCFCNTYIYKYVMFLIYFLFRICDILEVAEIARYASIAALFLFHAYNWILSSTYHMHVKYFSQPPLLLGTWPWVKCQRNGYKRDTCISGFCFPFHHSPFLLVIAGSSWQAMSHHKARETREEWQKMCYKKPASLHDLVE